MNVRDKPNRTIKSNITVFGIIEAIQQLNGAGVVELANHLDMAQSTIHDHLSTLKSLEYIVKKDSKYHLGLKFLELGTNARGRLSFFDIAQLELDILADKTDEVAWLYTEEYGRGIVLYRATGENGMETIGQVGWRPSLHSTSAGKAILAHLPERKVESIIERHGLPKRTNHTITTVEALFDNLERIRERGYAINTEEANEGIHAVGAPFIVDDQVLGAVCVSGPSHRFSEEYIHDTISNFVLDTVSQIELRLKYR